MNYKAIISLSFLIVALAVGYYFVIFLPHKDQEQVDLQKQAQAEKSIQIKAAQYTADQKAKDLRDCLLQADIDGGNFWNTECKGKGFDKDCALPTYNADRVDASIKDAKDLCIKEYPQ